MSFSDTPLDGGDFDTYTKMLKICAFCGDKIYLQGKEIPPIGVPATESESKWISVLAESDAWLCAGRHNPTDGHWPRQAF